MREVDLATFAALRDGGTAGWTRAGHPVIRGAHAAA
jgi:hypothetical protein